VKKAADEKAAAEKAAADKAAAEKAAAEKKAAADAAAKKEVILNAADCATTYSFAALGSKCTPCPYTQLG
jgi:hypothetical protein